MGEDVPQQPRNADQQNQYAGQHQRNPSPRRRLGLRRRLGDPEGIHEHADDEVERVHIDSIAENR